MGDIGGRSGGEVIQDADVVATGDQGICQVGADKTCTTGDKYAHEVSLRVEVILLKQDSLGNIVKHIRSLHNEKSEGLDS